MSGPHSQAFLHNGLGLSRERRAAAADKKLKPTAPIVGCRPLLAGSMVDLPLSKPSCIDAGSHTVAARNSTRRKAQTKCCLLTTLGKHRSTQDEILADDRPSSTASQRGDAHAHDSEPCACQRQVGTNSIRLTVLAMSRKRRGPAPSRTTKPRRADCRLHRRVRPIPESATPASA